MYSQHHIWSKYDEVPNIYTVVIDNIRNLHFGSDAITIRVTKYHINGFHVCKEAKNLFMYVEPTDGKKS